MDFPLTYPILDVEEDGLEGVELEGEGRQEVLAYIEGVEGGSDAFTLPIPISVDAVEITDDHEGQLVAACLVF